ncbi:hypothetical protein DICVIV_00699 [Dictyocaulus viviparus]|uniref:Uncharacterized protein n=1 Tax=Dictyocaulus viviparus TaxID=29172 RepID=A0A0D8YAH7_DICVI|nr:hypothetical protein DICVIV_00699 [Dictyocaulus viviparus]
MLIAMSIVCCLIAMLTENSCLFYPFLFAVTFEFILSFTFNCLLIMKIGWPKAYVAFIKDNRLESLQNFTKIGEKGNELLFVWHGFRSLYFALLCLTLVKTITDYQINEHRRLHNRYNFPVVVPYPRAVVLPEQVQGDTNPDDPPPYSTIVRDDEQTAKEETLPPRYSECNHTSVSDSSRSTLTIHTAGRNGRNCHDFNKTIIIREK